MKQGSSLLSLLVVSALMSGACTEILIGDRHFVDEGDGGGSGDGGSGGADPIVCSNGLTACDGACVYLDSDPRHCGSCDRNCYGASCDSGLCAVETVASDVGEPRGVAVDDAFVYWTTEAGEVQRAPKSGGATEKLIDAQESPGAIAVDEQYVYWINEESGRVVQLKKDGKGNAKTLATTPGLVGLALDGTGVFLSRKLKKGDIQRIPKEGGGSMVIATDQPQPTRIAASGNKIIWTGILDSEDGGASGGYVRSAPVEKGAPVDSLAEGEGTIVGLAIGGDMPIWADGTALTIRARPSGSSEPITLAEQQDVRGLAADSVRLYWTTATGTVKCLPLKGGEDGVPKALASDLPGAGAAVLDGTHLYFTRPGEILRVAK